MWSRTEGRGRDIIFIHGWMMDHRDEVRTYEPIFAGAAGWRRHYFDLPGMGRSPARPDIRDMDGMLAALLEAIDALIGGGRFLLAGTSAGGYLARGVVARLSARIDGLLLRAPLVIPPDGWRDVDPVSPILSDAAALGAVPEAERAALGEVLVQTPAYIRALREKICDAVAPASALADAAFLSPIRQDACRYSFSFDPDAVRVLFPGPSLVVAGRHDDSVGYRDAWRLAGKLPRSTYAVIDRAEHGLPIDQQDLFAALVRDWLARVAEARPGP
ncbi:alpha/beta hydrolase [Roseomonas hellenica]|uniref:Alpha/beta hydrolase n=1 Tax=Plastoroseomonas hellenica TaxID=2687306 RepID=A0ABS5F8X6_9PROT|nr:alpha/beta hydrolase [Plastoroseomonas hellenica]MBR0668997.1 alpha/beta hydrolase [Plastoroseomonas hellenica]